MHSDQELAGEMTEKVHPTNAEAEMETQGASKRDERAAHLERVQPLLVETYVKRSSFELVRTQMWLMFVRNLQIMGHYRWFVAVQVVIAPLFFYLILYAFQQADFQRQRLAVPNPPPYPLNGFGACQTGRLYNGGGCINFMFTPNTPRVRQIMSLVAQRNADRVGGTPLTVGTTEFSTLNTVPPSTLGMVPVADPDFIYNYAMATPNVTLYGVVFALQEDATPPNYQYELWYNYTLLANGTEIYSNEVLSVMRALDEAIVTMVNDNAATAPSTTFAVNLRDWPTLANQNPTDSMVALVGNIFFVCAVTTVLFLALILLLTEKELHLRAAMETMGLLPVVYYVSWFAALCIPTVATALLASAFGYMFNFSAFKMTAWPIVFSNYLLYQLALILMAFVINTLVTTVNAGVLVGLFPLMGSLTFQVFIFSNVFFGYIWYDPTTIPPAVGWVLSAVLPYFNFGRIFLDMSTLAQGSYSVSTDTYTPGPGMGLGMLYQRMADLYPNKMPSYSANGPIADPTPACQPLAFYLVNMGMSILILYLRERKQSSLWKLWLWVVSTYHVVFNTRTAQRQPAGSGSAVERWLNSSAVAGANNVSFANEDPAVAQEARDVRDPSKELALRVVGMRKVYPTGHWWQRGPKYEKVAVQSLNLGVVEGSCLAFLGQNGAGKTTSLSILCGLISATAGDALVYGHSVATEPHKISQLMGVCPQHDVLFDDLTAVQHIQLYGGLKGCSKEHIQRIVDERLALVHLDKVKDQASRTYSGGMKRRLSVVIATIGDPKVLILDEPTTGMDPVNRRHVWAFVEQFKRGRIVVLTSHSMEEVDVLGDRVAIMANGRLRALGNSVSLKSAFGAGYRISVVTAPAQNVQIQSKVEALVPGAALEDASAGALIYRLPLDALGSISRFLAWLDEPAVAGKIVRAWGLSQTSLEEVFLSLIRKAELSDKAEAEAAKGGKPTAAVTAAVEPSAPPAPSDSFPEMAKVASRDLTAGHFS